MQPITMSTSKQGAASSKTEKADIVKTANAPSASAPTYRVITSDSRPIDVSWVVCHDNGGALGLCHCPGMKFQRRNSNTSHQRDLMKDLQHLRSHWKVTMLVCLLNTAELSCYGLRDYYAQVTEFGLQVLVYPIIEMAAPDSLTAAAGVVEAVSMHVQAGHMVAMHCRGGVGRAGLMAACVLLHLGEADSAPEAIKLVRWRRCPEAIETKRQEEFVATYAAHLQKQRAALAVSADSDP